MSVHIDGLDLSTISRDLIRTRVITLPQDPVKFSNTVRQNLIPDEISLSSLSAGEDNNTRLKSALNKVGMWDLVHERGGLDAEG